MNNRINTEIIKKQYITDLSKANENSNSKFLPFNIKLIYKKIQEEIKDKLITKFLDKIIFQDQEILQLKKLCNHYQKSNVELIKKYLKFEDNNIKKNTNNSNFTTPNTYLKKNSNEQNLNNPMYKTPNYDKNFTKNQFYQNKIQFKNYIPKINKTSSIKQINNNLYKKINTPKTNETKLGFYENMYNKTTKNIIKTKNSFDPNINNNKLRMIISPQKINNNENIIIEYNNIPSRNIIQNSYSTYNIFNNLTEENRINTESNAFSNQIKYNDIIKINKDDFDKNKTKQKINFIHHMKHNSQGSISNINIFNNEETFTERNNFNPNSSMIIEEKIIDKLNNIFNPISFQTQKIVNTLSNSAKKGIKINNLYNTELNNYVQKLCKNNNNNNNDK